MVCGALPKSFSSKNDRLSVDNKQNITVSIFDVIKNKKQRLYDQRKSSLMLPSSKASWFSYGCF